MPYLVDALCDTRREIDGKWWIARPNVQPLYVRIANAVDVLLGKADAVVFREDIKNPDGDLSEFFKREFNFINVDNVNPDSPHSNEELRKEKMKWI